MDKQGWISLHRKIEEHWLWREPRIFSKAEAWLDILINVNHKSERVLVKGKLIECQRGQSVYSLETWRKRWNWKNKKSVRDFLKLLEEDSMIEYENLKYTLRLSIVNYDTYQYNGNGEVTAFRPNSKRRSNAEVTGSKRLFIGNAISYSDKGNGEVTESKRRSNAEVTPNKSREQDNNINSINSIFDYWNEQEIVIHKKLNDKIKRKISGTLNDFSIEEIKTGIKNYSIILKSNDYYWTHKWTLVEFLQRGLEKFIDWETANNNYSSKNTGIKDLTR